MVGSNENMPVIRPSHVQGGLRAVGDKQTNRRALSTINKNIIGAPPCPTALHKRGVLTEKNGIANKNPRLSVHRPITRKIAAKKVCTQPQPKVVVQVANKWDAEDYTIIDAEEDEPVPMYVQHTEAMMDEIDQKMDAEIEMEDIADEVVKDIDTADKKNPLAVVEYIDDLYAYYKKVENSSLVPPNYMSHQFDINDRMRGILIDWLIEVQHKFELMEETLYLTVNILDRFLANQTVVRKKLQLVGVTAMLLACKYEEVSIPVVEDLILISDKAYTRKEVLDMERLMVNTLRFNLSVPTPYVFMKRFLKAAQSDRKLELVSFFLIELCLVEYEMLRFRPSLLAAAAVFTAQATLSGIKQWSKTCEKHASYTEDELLECMKLMVTYHEKAGTGKLTGVYRKYNTYKYCYAAKTEPALFLLD